MMMKKEAQTLEVKQSWRDDFLQEICGYANVCGGVFCVSRVDDCMSVKGGRDVLK